MKILLMCSAGMTTSMLQSKMEEYIKKNSLDVQINALPANEAKLVANQYDVLLLGPQVRFMLNEFRKMFAHKIVDVISPQIYAMARGEEAVKFALSLKK